MDPARALASIDSALASLTAARAALASPPVIPPDFVPPVKPPAATVPVSYRLPRETTAAMTAIYGAPSESADSLAWFSFPHPGTRLYSRDGAALRSYVGDSRLDHRTHRLLADRLTNALAEIYAVLGPEQFEKEGWHVYGGSHNYRPKVGGSSLSTHAWAAAVDMNPAENVFAQRTTTFSDRAIDIMEKWGFLSGGRAWGKDWMHFQAVIPTISAGSYYDRTGLPKHITPA
jgi:hypothetical protein